MSKLNFFLILLLAGMLAFVKIQDTLASNVSAFPAQVVPTSTPTPTPTPIPVGIPIVIQIPRMQVNAVVQPVGTDFNGKMSMPEDWGKTAWYSGEGAYKPGEKGNAVIAGHLDTIYGTLGQFYNLDTLVVGDEVLVYDDLHRLRRFMVTHKAIYNYDQAPLQEIFGPSTEEHLNLITCMGGP
jgi:LPXTG-site transpeptidase (sortase) family protein